MIKVFKGCNMAFVLMVGIPSWLAIISTLHILKGRPIVPPKMAALEYWMIQVLIGTFLSFIAYAIVQMFRKTSRRQQ